MPMRIVAASEAPTARFVCVRRIADDVARFINLRVPVAAMGDLGGSLTT